MLKKFSFFLFFIILLLITTEIIAKDYQQNKYEPEKVINNLHKAIKNSEKQGNYKCCIQPSCTMCFLGKWEFEVGKCFCDDAIKKKK